MFINNIDKTVLKLFFIYIVICFFMLSCQRNRLDAQNVKAMIVEESGIFVKNGLIVSPTQIKNLNKIIEVVGKDKASQIFIDTLNDERWEVRAFSAYLLGEIKNKKYVQELTSLQKDKIIVVSGFATMSLKKIGEDNDTYDGILYLLKTLKDPAASFVDRMVAADLIGVINDRRAVPYLIDILYKIEKPSIRDQILKALGAIGDERAVPVIDEFLESHQSLSMNCQFALGALGKIGNKNAVDVLINFIQNVDNDLLLSPHIS